MRQIIFKNQGKGKGRKVQKKHNGSPQSFNAGLGQGMPNMNSKGFTAEDQLVRIRSSYRNAYTTSTVSTTGVGIAFTLSQFTDLATLASTFDEYRFKRIEAWVTTDANSGTESTNDAALICSAVDLDNASTPSTVDGLMQKPNALTMKFVGGGCNYHSWAPRAALAAYSGAFTSYSVAPIGTWFDCNSASVQHYGLKLCSDSTVAATKINVIIRAEVEFKGVV